MDFEPGDVVFVPFPYRDRDRLAESIRPAVVLSRCEFNRHGDLVIAAITSHQPRDSRDLAIRDWQAARLLKPSTVRMLIATVADMRVLHTVGHLSPFDWQGLQEKLRQSLELNA